MRLTWIFVRSVVAILFAVALVAEPVRAQKLPRSVTIASNPPGSLFYSLASGLAKVVSGKSPIQATVQPYSGTSTFQPLLNNGEIDFGVVNGVDMAMAYVGPKLKVGGRNPFQASPNIRLVMRGAALRIAAVVRKDSDIKSVKDVKGKRVTGEYPAQLAVWYNMYGILSSAGLTWKDVKVVPVPTVNEGVDALVQGRADVSAHALGSAKIKEADAAIGVRFVSIDCSPEGEKRLRAAVPGYYPTTVKAGASTGIVEDTCFETYDIYLATHKGAPNQVVTAVLKSLWDNTSQLLPLHPAFREWSHERAVSADITIPYHPAAVTFYKENGVWKPDVDQAQKKLLAMH